ncbi:MAG TPA: hypothetical protein VFH34_02985, partial [Anaerolineales bacterium]|nr:hypothetical protein [Anaerolineales bacterium]
GSDKATKLGLVGFKSNCLWTAYKRIPKINIQELDCKAGTFYTAKYIRIQTLYATTLTKGQMDSGTDSRCKAL